MKRVIMVLLLLLVTWQSFADYNRTAVISIPKCGNFLLMKLMKMISKKEPKVSSPHTNTLDWTTHFAINHELVKNSTVDFCRKNNVKIVFIYLDPRDQVVSGAYYLQKFGLGKKMTIPSLIDSLITNSFYWWRVVGLPNGIGTVTDFYNLMMQWSALDFVYTTTFEKIIGSRGGGDRAVQIEEIKKIAQFCGYLLDEDEVELIADALWGERSTFREGKIGAWKKEFTARQKNLFKQTAGQLLVDLGYEKDFNW
jgi:hypothetical protein